MIKILKSLLTFTLSGLIYSVSVGQVNSVYEKMSLDEILNVDVVVTASKKPEDLFETPLSVSIIKKADIINSGVTSIPEALRLSQGVIVREITPGNYDVQIRGFDEITKNAYISLPFNTTTLVMIDNRIVYSYFTGGTFWETLPIDINDVERIEIVRGPASALYGPNAVTGVINIITTHSANKGLNVFVDGKAGNKHTEKLNLNIGYNWRDKTKLSFSGNFDQRHRFKSEYFDYTNNTYTSIDNLSMNLMAVKDESTNETWSYPEYRDFLGAYYDTDVSLRKKGGNIFFQHNFSEEVNIHVAAGAQNSQCQRTGFLNFATALSQVNSESYYVDGRIKYKNLNGQLNLHSGEDLNNYKFNSYKFTNIDGNLEYYKQFRSISIRPGFSYKHATYNSPMTYDEPFSLTTLNYQFKDEPRTISSFAFSLLSEWKPTPNLRIIAAARVDKFSTNKYHSVNAEFAATYRLNKNNLIRYVFSRANRSPFIFDTYLNSSNKLTFDYLAPQNQASIPVSVNLNLMARKDLKFPTIINNEISWRTKLNPKLSFDIEVFYATSNNLVVSNVYRTVTMTQQLDESGNVDSISSAFCSGDIIFENFDLKAQQYGTSLIFDYNPGGNFNARIFATYQHTILTGRTKIEYNTLDITITEIPEKNERIISSKSFTNPSLYSNTLTPAVYGGLYLNYKTSKKWSLSTDAYFYTNQRFMDYDFNNMMADYTGMYRYEYIDIPANIVLNAKVTYQINKNISTYMIIKNILGKHREYGFADQIGTLFLIGVQWEL